MVAWCDLFLFFLPTLLGCDLYLAPSKLPGIERGVFGGKAYPLGSPVDVAPTILVNYLAIRKKQMSNYVFASHDNINSIAPFGSGMLFNHREPKNVLPYYFVDVPIPTSQVLPLTYSQPYSTYPMLTFVAELDIQPYEEIFTSYGESSWFLSRNITPAELPKNQTYISTYEELEANGHCITDVYVNNSTIPLAAKGLFSKRSFRKGEVVTISPVLFLSKKLLHKLSESSVVLNYCICSEHSDVCVLPIGFSSMINHGGVQANVNIQWYNWGDSSGSPPERLSWSAIELEKFPAAPLDISYHALRDISANEEILISYGDNWESQWLKYLHELQEWNQKYNSKQVHDYMKPQFRSPVNAPLHLFPESWHHTECIDQTGCNSQKKLMKRKKQIELKEIKQAKEFVDKYFQKPFE